MKTLLFIKNMMQTTKVFYYSVLLLFLLANSAFATTYFIDSVAGSDSNNGKTITTPWKNITKINALNITLGSKIFLKSGSVWTGQQLKFSGSGTAAFPIIIDKYGVGAKPIINGNGLTRANEGVVYLYNQDFIEINNLEITNYPPLTPLTTNPDSIFFVGVFTVGTGNKNPLGADRRGVMVAIKDKGVCNHIYFKNLDIHHVKGQLGNGNAPVNGGIPKRTGGIFFTVLNENPNSKSRYNDVLIDGCEISYCENIGIALDNEFNVYYPGGNELKDWFDRRFSKVKISNNTIHHIGKNAMIIRCTDETGLIEYNTCYETALAITGNTMFTARAKGTVFQYNEGYFNRSTTQQVNPGNIDGSMYDPDYGSIGIIFQYSYSHDNSEGIYWGCNTRSSNNNDTGIPDPDDVGCTLRYCISQNDLGALVFLNYPSAGNEIYNNVFYTKPGNFSPTILFENSTKQHTYNFYNNIIYNVGSRGGYNFADTGQTRTIKNNVFFGPHPSDEPADSNKLITDPRFVNPGSGTIGLNTIEGYKLQPTSPVLANGILVPSNGGFDLFRNTVSSKDLPDRGAHQYSTLSTLNWKKNGIKIYPNPIIGNQFTIVLPDSVSGDVFVTITTILGQKVYQTNATSNNSETIISPDTQLDAGIYMVTLKNQGKILNFKIVKK